MGNNGLLYEAGCVTSQYDQQLNYKWPFTYDYPPTDNLCNTGTSPTIKFPGNQNKKLDGMLKIYRRGAVCSLSADFY